jgi:hypothetical protein
MPDPTAAPRFRAYLDHTIGALVIERSEWIRLLTYEDQLVEIDLTETPMGAILSASEVVATFAERTPDGKAIITIVRNDPDDFPKPFNLYKYEVWEDVRQHLDVNQTVVASSTNEDAPLIQFLQDYVFIVPNEKGADHHLAELPGRYHALLKAKYPGA